MSKTITVPDEADLEIWMVGNIFNQLASCPRETRLRILQYLIDRFKEEVTA